MKSLVLGLLVLLQSALVFAGTPVNNVHEGFINCLPLEEPSCPTVDGLKKDFGFRGYPIEFASPSDVYLKARELTTMIGFLDAAVCPYSVVEGGLLRKYMLINLRIRVVDQCQVVVLPEIYRVPAFQPWN